LEFAIGPTMALPSTPSALSLPELFPGDSVSVTVMDLAEGIPSFSVEAGNLAIVNLPTMSPVTLTAGQVAQFTSDPIPVLVLPGSPTLGPASITPATLVLEVVLVPEPTTVTAAGLASCLLLRRRRRDGRA
jgi:hypothetical protein